MKTSSKISAKLVTAAVLALLGNPSQSEACEGRRVNPMNDLVRVADTVVADEKFEIPADFSTRDERKLVEEPLSPVGQLFLSKFQSRKGSGVLIAGPSGKACYVLSTLHILPKSKGVSQTDQAATPNLLGKSFEELREEKMDGVTFNIGNNFEKTVTGKIIGGGQARALPKTTEADASKITETQYEVDGAQDYVLIRLDESVRNDIAVPRKLNRNLKISRRLEDVNTAGLPVDLIRKNGGSLARFGSRCKAYPVSQQGQNFVRYNCTSLPGQSGGEVTVDGNSGEKLLETLVTHFHVRDLDKTAMVSEAHGPSIPHIADRIDQLMREYPCK